MMLKNVLVRVLLGGAPGDKSMMVRWRVLACLGECTGGCLWEGLGGGFDISMLGMCTRVMQTGYDAIS